MQKKKKIATAVGAAAGLVALGAGVAAASTPTTQGPSSSLAPVVIPTVAGASITSILSAGDLVDGYRLAGIPDGLGAFSNGDGTFTLLVNHELGSDKGKVRAHGAIGAFVSKLVIDSGTLKVRSGEDLIKRVRTWDAATTSWVDSVVTFGRFCSSDLAPVSAFYNEETHRGTRARILMNGEEVGNEGRAVAHVVTGSDAGTSYVLPWLGRSSWENWVAQPGTGDNTVLVGTDDSTPGQVYVYIGAKQRAGNDVERAGLTNGKLYGVKVDGIGAGVTKETDLTTVPVAGAAFTLVALGDKGDVSALTGAELQSQSQSADLTEFARPEDAAWDTARRGAFYVATTNSFAGKSRLWKLSFSNPRKPLHGGVAQIAFDGEAKKTSLVDAAQPGPRMLDNITVTRRGVVLAQEDVGNNDYVGGIWAFDPTSKAMTKVATHDPALFTPGAPGFLTKDEESSGIIPAPWLGEDAYLFDSQVHAAPADASLTTEVVERGQLLVLEFDDENDDDHGHRQEHGDH